VEGDDDTVNIWLISDLHLFHTNMLRGRAIGIRPFDTVDEMHEAIITGWNSVVKPVDKVYMLGDLTLSRPSKKGHIGGPDGDFQKYCNIEEVTKHLSGQKRIVLGNHDYWDSMFYHNVGFQKVLAMRVLGDTLLTHIPVHPGQFHRYKGNVHGHTHEVHMVKEITNIDDTRVPTVSIVRDTRYLNVCVEPLNYVPINLEDARKRLCV
jgi:calcineurin-like phosphoesterase family protein